jgi:hypothetical protein
MADNKEKENGAGQCHDDLLSIRGGPKTGGPDLMSANDG